MKDCDKRNIHTCSKLHVIRVPSNNDRHPVTKTSLHFTILHPITFHYACRQ